MNLEDYRADVLAMLSRIGAPEEFTQVARAAGSIADLKAVCYAAMFSIGEDFLALASGFKHLGMQREAAQSRLEGRLAMEPWNRTMGR